MRRLFTLNIRNILMMLRLMNELRARLAIHNKVNFKTATTRGGGWPKDWKHRMAVH